MWFLETEQRQYFLATSQLRQVSLFRLTYILHLISIFYQNSTYLVVYMFWTKLILVELGPYISIAFLNNALVIFLNISNASIALIAQILTTRKSSRANPRSAEAERRVNRIEWYQKISWQHKRLRQIVQEASMTRILIMIVILFIICQSIKLVPDVYEVYSCYGHPE